MLIISGTITIDPAQRAAALSYAKAVVAATRQEAGCNAYVMSADSLNEDAICVYELWESEEHLGAHFDTPHLAEFQQGIGGFGVTGMDLKKYQISSVGPLR